MTNGDKEELVSLSVVKSLMAVQENAFRSMIEVMFNGLREDIKEVKKDVVELQKSLEFSLKDVAEIEEKLSLVTKTVDKNCTSFEKQTMEVMRAEIYLFIYFIYFILSYLNTKPYQLKKKRETIQMSICIYIKSYNFAGLPRDRASGRMLIL